VLCFNAHFGANASMMAQDAMNYARLIDTSGASVVCMQEIDALMNQPGCPADGIRVSQADEILDYPRMESWRSGYYGARTINLPRGRKAGGCGLWLRFKMVHKMVYGGVGQGSSSG
jgi:hypothetical protein